MLVDVIRSVKRKLKMATNAETYTLVLLRAQTLRENTLI